MTLERLRITVYEHLPTFFLLTSAPSISIFKHAYLSSLIFHILVQISYHQRHLHWAIPLLVGLTML